MQQLGDPELKKLAEGLPSTVVSSRADSTVAKYLRAFQRWKNWVACHATEIAVYPVKEAHFALYLQYLAETSKSKATVRDGGGCERNSFGVTTCRSSAGVSFAIHPRNTGGLAATASSPKSSKRASDRGDAEQHGRKPRVFP